MSIAHVKTSALGINVIYPARHQTDISSRREKKDSRYPAAAVADKNAASIRLILQFLDLSHDHPYIVHSARQPSQSSVFPAPSRTSPDIFQHAFPHRPPY